MASNDKKISAFPAVTSLAGSDLVVLDRAGVTNNSTVQKIDDFVQLEKDSKTIETILTDLMYLTLRTSDTGGSSEKTSLLTLSNYIKAQTLDKFVNYIAENGSNPAYEVDVSADELQIGNIRETSFSATADLTASGFNGLDTGSEANSTWYYLYAIAGAGQTSGSTYSLSSTSPTLPSGYTEKVLRTLVYNDSSGNLDTFYQKDNDVKRIQNTMITSQNQTSYTAIPLAVHAPDFSLISGLKLKISAVLGSGVSGSYYINGSNSTTITDIVERVGVEGTWSFTHKINPESSNIYYKVESSGIALTISSDGFTLNI